VRYGVWALVLVPVLVCLVACTQRIKKNQPLLLRELDESEDHSPPPKGPVADNTRCYVCHVNFEGETLARHHARANVGCVKCHGVSIAHASSEENVVPPEIMYPKDKIVAACTRCHTDLTDSTHKDVIASTATKNRYCTDCHAKGHHVAHRTRLWDRNTGQLIMRK
jgi:hypothetical protein